MPMARIRSNEPVTRTEFHARLRAWLRDSQDVRVGPVDVAGVTGWIYVKDGGTVFRLHADTSREAVQKYLELVDSIGEDLAWVPTVNQRGRANAVAYGPDAVRLVPFYFYVHRES